ncbi:MAG: AAA family ATPase [Candidatus Hodarchaeota archaeon]
MDISDNSDDIGESEITSTSENAFFKISNPYRAYDLESGRWFYYEDVVKNIKNIFEKKTTQKIIIIQGNQGSGKTSTLCRMQEDKKILGERYKTIYIDSDEFRSNEVDLYLAYIYKSSIKGLRHEDLQLDVTDLWIEQRISLNELKSFIKELDQSLDKSKILILIFDEFDKLQRTIENPLVIKSIIDFFYYIINETKRIRLILSGERQILELARKTNTQNFFQSALLINIEEIFEPQEIRKLIIDPVEGHITYDPKAIKNILDITGRNLYCQQLLCSYIFNYLTEARCKICHSNDVHQSVERLINDKREDFIYYWKNINWRYQIIVSALADEHITKKKGQKYFIEELSLLNAIFGKETFTFLRRLYNDQQISKFEGIRFDENPFKVPLFGEWVTKNHSFIDTLIDNWEHISNYVSLTSLHRIMELIPSDKVPLDKDIIETTSILSKIWTDLQMKIKEKKSDRSLVEALIYTFCELLGFEVKDKPTGRKTYFTINMNRLNLGGLEDVLFFIPVKEELDDLDVSFIQDEILRQDKPGNPSFILCLRKSEKILELIKKQFLGLVLLEENDLKNIVLSSHPLQVFTKEIILKQVKPSAISIYRTEGPVKVTFFGRHDEIGKIIKTKKKNFAIVGARKIGKTSLLQKIKDELPSSLVPIYLDLEAPQDQNYETFLYLLSEEMSHAYYWIDEIYCDFSTMRRVIRKLRQQDSKTPLFILDEIDALLKFDRENDYRLLKTFRSLFNEGLVQIIISGYEELYHDKHKIDSPLYNFCHPLQLDKLEKSEALDLVTIPMERIGVSYNKLEDRELMLDYTSRHPNLLQFFCVHLIEKIETHEEEDQQRVIFREDIESVFESPGYENYVIDDFYLFFKEDVSPIEKLIVLLLVNYYHYNNYTTTEISKILKERDISMSSGKLTRYLDNLILRYILSKERGGKYSFALPIFPEILRRRYDLENIIEETLEDAKKSL